MLRSVRPSVLLVLLVAVACTDQPTEPTTAEVPFQVVLGPPPADVAPLHGTLPAGTGGPAQIALGFWESPALARVTVSGLLTWSNPGTVDGYFPRPGGQLNYLGRYIPSLNLCASQLSVRVIGYGAVGGADGGCPGYWQTVASVTTYSIVSGQVVLARSAPALGACYYGGIGCTTLSGEQEATVAPVDGQLTIKLDTTRAYPGQLVGVHFGTAPVAEGGMLLPWSLREIRFEGSGPILGGGTPKGCESWYSSSFCGIRIYQSGYVVAEGMVSGKLRIQKEWIKVLGGDSLPPPLPPDSIPADTLPTDTIPGGGGGGGGCSSAIAGRLALNSGPMAVCEPPTPVRANLSLRPGPETPILSGGRPWILPERTVAPDGGEYKDFGSPPLSFGRPWPDSAVYEIHLDSVGSGIGRTVTVLLESFDSAGTSIDEPFGHTHFGRLVNGEIPPKPAGGVNSVSVSTDSSGNAKFVYHPSEVSGPVLVKIIAQNADTVRDTLWVGVPNLVALSGGSKYDLKQESDGEHPDRFWVTEGMRALLDDFGDSIVVNFVQRPVITDAGLRFGGKYDLDSQWASADPTCILTQVGQPPAPNPDGCHYRHRMGHDADLRTNDSTRERLILIQRLWRELTGIQVFQEGDHYHLRYRE